MLNPIPTAIFFTLHILLIQSQTHTSNHSRCPPFRCDHIDFPFPFSDQSTFGSGTIVCGLPGYQILCDEEEEEESTPVPILMISTQPYQVKNIFLNQSYDEGVVNLITLVNTDLIRDINTASCHSFRNFTSPSSGLLLPDWNINLTFFKCPSQFAPPQDFSDQTALNYTCNDEQSRLYLGRYVNRSQINPTERSFNNSITPRDCNLVMLPVSSADINVSSVNNGDMERSQLSKVLAAGFTLQWKSDVDCENCIKKKGRCGFDRTKVVCLCDDGCNNTNSSKPKLSQVHKIIIGVACGIFSIVVIVALLVYKNRASLISTAYLKKKKKNQTTSDGPNAEEFIKTYRSNLLSNYSYNGIKKMTNGFKDKLGEGGYGNVYKGKLFDGRIIAVKLLKSADIIIGDNFITEVATIGRIHHFNVINLLGFCWDGSKQALIYEYMPNGSLKDLLSKEEAENSVGIAKLLEIAIGVAQGIEYLHNGCESRILHLDIKPQNVLLDQSLNPKISDFGLAKVYSRDHSYVTMTSARGTIGFIAPEIFMRNLGNPSHKSDVYSYGMLLLEMVGGKQQFKQITSFSTGGSSGTEAYFPEWIYEKVMEKMDNVVDESYEIGRKMRMVGLWCIQMKQRDRPSMKRVVEMLSGRMEDIEMPPKPLFVFSLPRQHVFEDQINTLGSDSNVLPFT
ncbi:hypothetical protein J1N35_035005 [Gossypium stocksii]|uniref:Protein kinase domain-containing protein n=1 Tax=Gossypium stocksii TaxID=47602 RepID=A0A9D3UT48_9ROSI|nr:hypothetical protein J1N35_035005 [Gossypium stocksii]